MQVIVETDGCATRHHCSIVTPQALSMSPVILRIAVIEEPPSRFRPTAGSRRWRVAVNDVVTYPRFASSEEAQEYAEDVRHGRMPALRPEDSDTISRQFARSG